MLSHLNDNEINFLLQLKTDFPLFAEKILKIRTKSGEIKPFVLNREQLDLHNRLERQLRENKKVRVIILKGRQQGISTYIQARIFWKITQNVGKQAFILTHETAATQNIFSIADRYYMNAPELMRPTKTISNATEMIFSGLDSGYAVGTARNKDVGRSGTMQYLHGSEVAFWLHGHDIAKGLMNCVPREPDTEIYLESTANGMNNYFNEQWELAVSGESDYEACFYPWFWHVGYSETLPSRFIITEEEREYASLYNLTPEQIYWRRLKIAEFGGKGRNGEAAFKQEYPSNAIEAFQASNEDFLIKSDWVVEARKERNLEALGALIIGVDPARFGKDKTAIIRRRGRFAYKLEYHHKFDTMQITGLLTRIARDERPDKIFVDVGGLGAGIVDRAKEIKELEDIVEGINFGSASLYEDKYFNKRAEMWAEMALWFQEPPVQIPNDDALHSDLCNIGCIPDSQGRLKLEPKEAAIKRLGRSPDGGDAFALTFARPINNISTSKHSAIAELNYFNHQAQSFWGI